MTRKTKRILSIATLAIALAVLVSSCKKDEDPNIQSITFEREYFNYTPTTVTVSGLYSYGGKIDGIKMQVGKRNDLADARAFEADIDGTNYTVEITDLQPGTEYHYCYEVDYGFSKPYKTETKTFSTPADSPVVKTLEVMAIDSTTFRVKCEVVAEGGQEVTERGICWNTYGDPTLDDETMQHTSGGVGQYTLRMEILPANTRYYVRAYAKNGTGIGFGEVLDFKTGGETTKPQVSTVEVSGVTYNAATCLSNVSSDGGLELTERGVCWGLEPDPTVNVHKVPAEGTETGNYTVTIEGLNPNTDYHVRAYAVNEKGTSYGEDLPFTTTDGKPTVTTAAVTDITATSATGGGNVTDEGASPVTERGICWSTNHEPTTNGSHASSGTGAGSYSCNITSLVPNETYYVRAYATNGQGTAYGAEVEFVAREGMPVVATLDVTDITATSAKAHGKVSNQGGSAVTERGICWSTEPSPTINGSHAHSGTGAGEYTVDMTGLAPGTKYYVRAYAINAQGMTYGGQEDFTTEATVPTVATGSINGTTVSGEVTSEGGATVTERGVCWSTSHTPTLDGSHGSSGSGLGTFSVELTDLAPGTTYYVRAYATNSAGTAYGSEKTLTTEANLPTVTTGEVTNIGQTTAQGSGNVTYSGGAMVTERGICWSTSHTPTINGSHANSGTGMGGFTVSMTGLTANTHYYVRAYAKNSAGVSYGNEVDFTTSQNTSAPTVTTSQVTNITQTSATGGGNVTSDGGATVTERGICWSTSHNPTTSGSHASNGTGTGSYTVNMTGLTSGTQYYVRAYAINNQGTSYGNEVAFTTLGGATLPTVVTVSNGIILGGNVLDDGGAVVTDRGICFSTQPDPANSGEYISGGSGLGEYFVELPPLVPNTDYYYCAYATNSVGTAYGGGGSFIIPGQNYTITVSANPSNGGTVSGGGTYQQGQSCTVTATANNGYAFVNWTENGNVVSTNASYTFTVNGNRTLVANFTSGSGHAYVDLGLPSGLLWATCNVGADNPEDYGDYFAWGETQTKSEYNWSTYQYCNGSNYTLTKYCYDSSYGYNGFTDNLTTLQPSDDAATAQWGSGWRMPTKEEWQELYQNTTRVWTTQNGVNGRLFTATNGNSLFLPAAGFRYGTSLDGAGTGGYYWSSSLYTVTPYDAWSLYFSSGGCGMGDGGRYYGFSVRPVRSASKN